VPYEAVADQIPRWNLAAYVDASPAGIEAVPFVVGDLAVVRPATGEAVSRAELRRSVLDQYMNETRDGGRSDRATTEPRLIRPPATDAVETAWFGEGWPVGATKATPAAFRNKLDRRPDPGDIEIAVVCNDAAMRAEDDAVRAAYGSRAALPFDVSLHRDLTVRQFRALLVDGVDFLHYVGHVDDGGFECADGHLDATALDSVAVGAFLLNACQSYEQGMALVEAGSVGGVVTLSDVVDSGALRVGKSMARLLDLGFPLRAALDIAAGESVVGGHYTVIGDGRVSVVQEEAGVSILCLVEEVGEQYQLSVHAYLPRERGTGTAAQTTIPDSEQHYLAPGPIGRFRLSADRLREYLAGHRYPVKKGGALHWNVDSIEL